MTDKQECKKPCRNCYSAKNRLFTKGCLHQELNTFGFWRGVIFTYRELRPMRYNQGKRYQAWLDKWRKYRQQLIAQRFPCVLSEDEKKARVEASDRYVERRDAKINALLADI